MGAPVARASAAGPRISDRTAYEWEIPASGKIPTASPSRRRRRAVRYAAAGASRSTGTWRMPSMARAKRECQTSCRVKNRTQRPRSWAASPIQRKSG